MLYQTQVNYAGSKSGVISSMMPSMYNQSRVYYEESSLNNDDAIGKSQDDN